jgi:hypothetical protein
MINQLVILILTILYFSTIIKGIQFAVSKFVELIKLNSSSDVTGFGLLIYIIFGYFFYLINLLNLYTLSILVLGVYSYLKGVRIARKIRIKYNYRFSLFLALIVFLAIFYAQSFDALNHISTSHPDSLSSLNWFTVFSQVKIPAYPPGLYILCSGIYSLFDMKNYVNIIGLAISLVINIEIYKLLNGIIKEKSKYIFLLVTLLPIFNSIIFTRVGFNSGQLTFLWLINLIAIFSRLIKKDPIGKQFWTLIISSLIVQPHVVLSWFIPIVATTFYLYKAKIINQIKFLIPILSVPLISIVTYLILANYSLSTFNLTDMSNFKQKHFINILWENLFSIVGIKGHIRPWDESILSVGAYIGICILVIILFVTKDEQLKVISIFALFMGLVVVTGMFELSYFKGRTGLYYFYLIVLVMILIYEKIKFSLRTENSLIILLAIILFINPPIAYRIFDEKVFYTVKSLQSQLNITSLYTQFDSMDLLTNNNQSKKIDLNTSQSELNYNYYLIQKNIPQLIILNNNKNLPSPYFSGHKRYEDRDIKGFYERSRLSNQLNIINNGKMINLLVGKKYKIIRKEEDYVILSLLSISES